MPSWNHSKPSFVNFTHVVNDTGKYSTLNGDTVDRINLMLERMRVLTNKLDRAKRRGDNGQVKKLTYHLDRVHVDLVLLTSRMDSAA